MLFNSLEYIIFLPIVFGLYWALSRNRKAQNMLLLAASYAFYAYWDYRFLSLIILSSAIDFYLGKAIHANQDDKKRKNLLMLSVAANIGILGVFKYFDFFIDSANHLLSALGFATQYDLLELIFPVGISFYTFQTLSYTIDVYRRKIEPTNDAVAFFGFVSFFPQLVAGPIERANDLLPQFKIDRKFDYSTAMDGMRQILWGMFKKVVVADNAALIVDSIFAHYESATPLILFAGAGFFFVQVYGDFSGYSDIAIGTAKLLGYKLSVNFASPFFSRSFSEFWRRWHITLNTWFRDYVYFPLGGSRQGKLKHLFNISVVFVVCGFWHGAAWTFIIWGFLNAIYFVVEQRFNLVPENQTPLENLRFPKPGDVFQMLVVFSAIAVSLVFFRSPDLGSALDYFAEMKDFFGPNNYEISNSTKNVVDFYGVFIYILIMLLFEWKNKANSHGLQVISKYRVVRLSAYFFFTLLCLHYFYGDNAFVYFQF